MNIHATVERHKNTKNMTLMSCLGGTWPGRKTLCNSLVKSNQTQKSTAQKKNKAVFFRPALLDSFHWFISNEGQTLKN